eukprot:325423-Pleurochrysis_carterae.AAC.2
MEPRLQRVLAAKLDAPDTTEGTERTRALSRITPTEPPAGTCGASTRFERSVRANAHACATAEHQKGSARGRRCTQEEHGAGLAGRRKT